MRLVVNGTDRYLVHNRKTQSIKPERNANGSVNLKSNHVKETLLHNVDKLPSKIPENVIDTGDFVDFDMILVDIFDGALAEMGFDDQAPTTGLIINESLFDDEIGLSYFTLTSILPDNINVPAPFCAAKETLYRKSDVEAALMTDDVENNMIIDDISLESYQSLIKLFSTSDSQGHLEVPATDKLVVSELEDASLEDIDLDFASELEAALLEEAEEDDSFASELEATLLKAEQNRTACLRECRRQFQHARQITWLPPTSDPTTLALRAALKGF